MAFGLLLPMSAGADAVTETCMQTYPQEACECGSAALLEELGGEDYEAYGVISTTAAEQQAAGAGLVDAWEVATQAHATARGLSGSAARDEVNRFGSAHRAAITSCAGN